MKGIKQVELVEVIRVRAVVGDGTKENPVREVIQYWEKNGKKIAEKNEYEAMSGRHSRMTSFLGFLR